MKSLKKWFKKIRLEYRKSKMNLVKFIYWTIRSNYDGWKLKKLQVKRIEAENNKLESTKIIERIIAKIDDSKNYA